MQNQPSKVLKVGRVYDLADLFIDSRLIGFEVSATESTMQGVRLKLVSAPPLATSVQLDSSDDLAE